jgi:hypothetical protein
MGNPKWVLAPWAVLLLLQLACASHHARLSLETEAASPSVPASIVSPLLRTGYHFQPPMNWINGKTSTTGLLSLELSEFSLVMLFCVFKLSYTIYHVIYSYRKLCK